MKQQIFLGVRPRVPAHLLPENTAAHALNADLSRGVLAPLREDELLREAAPGTQAWVGSGGCRVDLPCDAAVVSRFGGCADVYATGVAPYPVWATEAHWPVRHYTRLGIPAPPGPPAVVWGPVTLRENETVERAFFYAYVDDRGAIGPGSPPTEAALVNWDTLALVGGFLPPPAEYRLTHVAVFMLQPGVANMTGTPAAEEAKWFEIARGPVGATVEVSEATNLGPTYDAYDDFPPPEDLRDLQGWNDTILAGLSGDMLVFSETDRPWAWPDKYRMRFKSPPIRFLVSSGFGYVLTCGAPEVVTMQHDNSRGGARDILTHVEDLPLAGARAAATHEGACFYATHSGVVMLSGTRPPKVITLDLWTPDQWAALLPHTMVFAIHRGHLFISGADFAVRFRVPSATFDGPIGDVTYLDLRTQSFTTQGGELFYVGAAGGLYRWGRGLSRRAYTYETREVTLPGRAAPRALLLNAEGPDVEVEVWLGRQRLWAGRPLPGVAQGLPRGLRGDTIKIILRGTDTVTDVAVAPSIEDLRR
jgi:hypothetical protein